MRHLSQLINKHMKHFATAFIVLTISCCSNSSNQLVHMDELVNKSNSDDRIMFLNDKLYSGVAFRNHENGKRKFEIDYKKGLQHGTGYTFNEDGELTSESEFKNGKKHGKAVGYFSDSQQVEYEEIWENGIAKSFKYFYKNGNVYQTGKYLNGKIDGLVKEYQEEYAGELVMTTNYSNGYKSGEEKVYFNNDIIAINTYTSSKLVNSEFTEVYYVKYLPKLEGIYYTGASYDNCSYISFSPPNEYHSDYIAWTGNKTNGVTNCKTKGNYSKNMSSIQVSGLNNPNCSSIAGRNGKWELTNNGVISPKGILFRKK